MSTMEALSRGVKSRCNGPVNCQIRKIINSQQKEWGMALLPARQTHMINYFKSFPGSLPNI